MGSLRSRTLVLAMGEFVNTGLTAFMAVVLTRVLTKEAYGTYRQVLLVYTMLVAVFGSHIAESLLYFLPRSRPEDRPRWVGQTTVVSLLIGGLLGSVLFLTANAWGEWTGNPRLPDLIRVFAFFPLADRIVRLVSPGLIAVDRAGTAATYTVLVGVVKVLSAVVPCVLGMSLAVVFWTANGCWLLLALLGFAILVSRTGVQWGIPGGGDVREQFSYVVPLMAGWIVATFQEQLGQFVASAALTTAQYAEYAVGAVQLPLVGIWTASIASAMMPDLVRFAGEGRREDMLALWHRGARKGAIVIFPIAALALVVPDHLIRLLYGPGYSRAVIPFVLFLLALPARVANYGVTFRALGRTRAVLVWTLTGLLVNVTVTVSLVLLGRGTILVFAGPAVGYLIGYYATVGVVIVMLGRLMSVPMSRVLPLRNLAPLALLSFSSAAVAALIRLTPVASWVSSLAGPETATRVAPGTVAAAVHCVLAAAAFGSCYLGLGFATGTFDEGERALLLGALRWKTGSRRA